MIMSIFCCFLKMHNKLKYAIMLLRYISLCLVYELLARQEDIYFQVNEEITAQKSNDKYR